MNISSERRWRVTAQLDLLATVLLILVAGVVGGLTVWDRLHPRPSRAAPLESAPPRDPVPIAGAPIRGDTRARVALIEFSDFECSYCGRVARELLPQFERQYLRTGKVFLVWRHYPLAIHQNARKTAEAAACAGRQGKFWEFHDWAFQHQQEHDTAGLRAAVNGLGLDVAAFGACLDGQATAEVQADIDLGNAVSIAGTPAWLIGIVQADGKVKVVNRLTGAKPFAAFQEAIDRVMMTVDRSDH